MTLINDAVPVDTANGHALPMSRIDVAPLPSRPVEDAVPELAIGESASATEDATKPAGEPVRPVGQAAAGEPSALPSTVPGQRRALAPVWVTDQAQRKAAAAWAVKWTGHGVAFHALRLPKYTARACLYAPRGGVRAAAGWLRWLFDWDAHGLRLDLVQKREAGAYHTAARHRDDRVKNRAIGSLAALIAVPVALYVAGRLFAPAPYLLLAVGLGALLWHGRPVGKPFLIDHAVLPTQVMRLTADVVARALSALGIAELRKAMERREIAFTAPITRDGGGWRAEVDLPYGITAVDVIEKRRELSSGLRRPMGCVWPEPVEEEHSGHLTLWVGDRTLAKTPAVAYPLLESGTTDMFGPLPFGVDQRGKAQTVTLMFASAAVGAQPRMGKTFAVRLLALAAALDPSCQLHIYDGKGMGDYVMFEPVAHTFLSGSRTETLLQLRDALLDLKDEVDRRAVLLTKLTREGKCREGKISPELSKIPAYGLFPIAVILDECHLAFDTGSGKDGKLGEEISGLAEYLVRVGPAAGVSTLASTQRPDAKSLPSGIRANVQIRYCLRVADQPTNDMVLGTSAYKTGVRATEFGLGDKGIGYLSGEGAEAVIVRTYYVDADQAGHIVARARAAREAAGTLSGMAAGIEPVRGSTAAELLADVLTAMGADDKCWSEALCARLAETNPRYTGWDPTTLAKSLKPLGVVTEQTWWTPPTGKAGNRNGLRREQITDALTAIREKIV